MSRHKWLIIALSVAVLTSQGVFYQYQAGAWGKGEIALIRLSGSIAESAQSELLNIPGITPSRVGSLLEKATAENNVKAVVLRIDSPGGAVAASQEIAAMIRQFVKPVVVSMGDVAASGGYYISVYADRIVANPGTTTGSIGVITQVIHIEGLLEKLGLNMETIKSGRLKGMGLSELSEEEYQVLQTMCDEMYEEFIQVVAEGRHLDPHYVRQLATGQAYTGAQALKLGLVDELGGLQVAIKAAAKLAGLRQPVVKEYKETPPLWRQAADFFFHPESPPQPQLSNDQLLFLRVLEGWQAMPCY